MRLRSIRVCGFRHLLPWIGSMGLLLQHCTSPSQFQETDPEQTGVRFRNEITETEHNNIMTYEYTYNGGGVAVGDVNGDGLADLYFSGNSVPNQLYLNQGNWQFRDVTTAAQVAGRRDWATGVTMADVNGDGRLDLYVCYSGNTPGEGVNRPVIRDRPQRANQLFINQGVNADGVPTFVEQAKAYGLDAPGTFSTQAYFFDYDRDGDLDLFLLNHANMFYSTFFNVKKLRSLRHPYFGNKLYRNDQQHFVEVSDAAGIHGSGLNFGLSAGISDLNGDGWPDLYVTNDYDEQDFCYLNNQDGTFREVSHTLFGHLSKYGMGSDIADINNDGRPDVFVNDMLPEDNHRQKLLKGPDEYDKHTLAVDSGYHHQYMRNTLQLNQGLAPDSLPRFSELGQLAGVASTDWSWAPLFADFDNDGRKDLFITNGYLHDYTNMDFLKYTVQDVVAEANRENHPVDVLGLIQRMPSTKLSNYAFRNEAGLRFSNQTKAWGLDQAFISNAAAYADLDNDGDLDLVVSHLNDQVSLYRNNQEQLQKNHYLKVKLEGLAPNTGGIGATVRVTTPDQEIYQEAYFTRGYQSSVEPLLTIGVGDATTVPEVQVVWPDQRVSVLTQVTADQTLVVRQADARPGTAPVPVPPAPLLEDITATSGLDFVHQENEYVDFKSDQLLLYQLSRLGGKMAVGDVDGDGNDDVFFGGAAGQSGQLYWGQDDGTFRRQADQPWADDAAHEDAGATFFDANGDGALDLYVVSGGSEFPIEDRRYQDRLYLNQGRGQFVKAEGALPAETVSGSCVTAADFDHDGDLDLFVGGRLQPDYYPYTPKSFLLRNDSDGRTVRFTDVAATMSESLAGAGMVTDAVWADLDADQWPELVVVGEWMPVMVFRNENGRLQRADEAVLHESQGWWSAVAVSDVDGDGDPDLLLGNAGTNLPFQASPEEPLTCHTLDLNQDGNLDPIVCTYVQGKAYPLPSRDELLQQVNPLRKKFIRYSDYADATLEDVMGKNQMAEAHVLTATMLTSSWLENQGGRWHLRPLPAGAQTSMIHGFVQEDFDHDGRPEVLAAGNFYPYRVQIGRSDASTGTLLRYQEGALQADAQVRLWLTGDIRDVALVRSKRGGTRVLVSRNNAAPGLYRMRPTGETDPHKAHPDRNAL